MTSIERTLRNLLVFQGIFYLSVNLWALVATPGFLSYANPSGDLFEARSFAALSSVLAIFFLVGAWRNDLLRPASFLGLGSAAAIVLVELFHLPALGWTLLWVDFLVELGMAAFYIMLFFFRHEQKEDGKKESSSADESATAAAVPATVLDTPSSDASSDAASADAGSSDVGSSSSDGGGGGSGD